MIFFPLLSAWRPDSDLTWSFIFSRAGKIIFIKLLSESFERITAITLPLTTMNLLQRLKGNRHIFFFLIENKQVLFTCHRNFPLNDLSILTLVTELVKSEIASWSSHYFCTFFLILHYLFECVKNTFLYVCCKYFLIFFIMQTNEVSVQGALRFKSLSTFTASRTQ